MRIRMHALGDSPKSLVPDQEEGTSSRMCPSYALLAAAIGLAFFGDGLCAAIDDWTSTKLASCTSVPAMSEALAP